MRLCYKHCSSHSNMEKLWCLGNNTITDIFSQMGIIDGKSLSLSSQDIEFEKVTYNTEKNSNNNKGNLVRFEFMEMMVRIGGAICFPKKICETWNESVKYFFDNYTMKFFEQFHNHPWRVSKFWFEENDYIFKLHKLIVDNVFQQYSGKKTLPGKVPFIILNTIRKDGCPWKSLEPLLLIRKLIKRSPKETLPLYSTLA